MKELSKEMTVKAGQKCTAIRRAIIPEKYIDDVSIALKERLEKVTIGEPPQKEVRMGPLASAEQKSEVLDKIRELKQHCQVVIDNNDKFDVIGGCPSKGAFVAPTVLLCESPLKNKDVHEIEAFGPVTTLMPYNGAEEAIKLAKMGEGSLVGSLVTSDQQITREIVIGSASHHGRLLVLNKSCAKESTGHGSPLPSLVHGGPGRAGGGEEMGGVRGVFHYMQRTAIQGHPDSIMAITQTYQEGATQTFDQIHPFKKYFEELHIGDCHKTHGRTVTEADIIQFANVSWDHFYAHTDITSLDGSFFEERVAHGYFIMSAAAGLFVDPAKGPVMANYGLDDLRFVKPVYAGTTIFVELTVKEKIDQENKEDEKPRGIVKWQVTVKDQLEELVALGTILTLVEKKGL